MAWDTLGVPAQAAGWHTIAPNTGSGWQDFAATSGSGVPLDASGNLGDRYFDTTAQRWYLKRWVANREGAGDSILFPINLFPSVGDFDFSVMVRMDTAIDDYLVLATTSPDVTRAYQLRINGGNSRHEMLLRDGATSSAQHILTSTTALSNTWKTVRGYRVGSVLAVSVDGVTTGTIADTSAWTPSTTQTGTFALRALSVSSISIKCCNLRLTGPGGSIISPLNDGTGTTIKNSAGANGTLTDGTPKNFWYQAWVPLDLL